MNLSVWDFSGKEEHTSLRDFAYGKADAVIFCFTLAETSEALSKDSVAVKASVSMLSLINV